MTEDRFLHSLRREPPPALTRSVLARVREAADAEEARGPFRLAPVLSAAAGVAMVVALFLFPSVRASAQAFLDLFRVRNFVAVEFDPARMERLRSLDQDRALMVFDRKEELQDPGQPADVANRAAAEAAAGIPVLEPGFVPGGLTREKFQVNGEGRMRLSARADQLQAILATLDLKDVQVPPGIDGQWIEVHTYPVAFQRWASQRRHVMLLQARSPEVKLPAGFDLPRLAEVGLRILGLSEGEARRIAGSVDWSSTMLVPVPVNASRFQEVTVRGQKGLLVTTSRVGDDGQRREGAVLLWTESDRVFALNGNLSSSDLLQMAGSLR